MKQASIVGLLLTFLIFILGLFGATLFLWNERQELIAEAARYEPEAVAAQATLVQVMGERQDEMATQAAAESTQAAAETAVAAQLMGQEQSVDALEEQVAALQAALTAVADNPSGRTDGTPIPEEPLVRLLLRDQLTTRRVGDPVEVIASATHPDGIAAINIAVNGQPLAAGSPSDPALHIVTAQFTPEEVGEYRITALATTTRGRAGVPVPLTINVIDNEADINASIREQITKNVVELRGLDLLSEVETALVTSEQVNSQLQADYQSPELAAQREVDLLTWQAFDFAPAGLTTDDLIPPAFGAFVAGYYEPNSDQLFVVSNDEIMSQEAQLTYAHEFMHALQDQHFSLGLIDGRGQSDLSRDGQLALRAFGEGEAVLIEFLYEARGYLTGEELDEDEQVYGTPEYEGVPDFLVSEFTFPYARGYDFVSTLYEAGGIAAVNEAWETFPQSTEQILHPERYLSGDEPLAVMVPTIDVLDEAWQLIDENVLGEFYLREYLLQQLDRETAALAAEGWGGDRYALYVNDTTAEQILIYKLVWDSAADLDEFAASYRQFAEQRMATGGDLLDEQTTCWISQGERLCLRTDTNQLSTWVVRMPERPGFDAIFDFLQ